MMLFVGVMRNGAAKPPPFVAVSMMKLGPEPSPPYHVSLRMLRMKAEVLLLGMFVVVKAIILSPAYPTESPSPENVTVLRDPAPRTSSLLPGALVPTPTLPVLVLVMSSGLPGGVGVAHCALVAVGQSIHNASRQSAE